MAEGSPDYEHHIQHPLAPGIGLAAPLSARAGRRSTIIAEMRAQAVLGREAGFDGMMTSEHHGGFGGYLPNPLQVAGWLLDAMPSGWAAACPLLLPLRPAALVIEEAAWLAARFPGRVGLGVATGSLQADFDILDTTKDGLVQRFASGLTRVADALSGRDPGDLAGDAAVAGCREAPVPVMSAAMSPAAVRRAAAAGAGLLFDSLSTIERCRMLTDTYREAGAPAAALMVRRAWVGPPPRSRLDQQVDLYRTLRRRRRRRATGQTTRCSPAPTRPNSPRCSSRP